MDILKNVTNFMQQLKYMVTEKTLN